MKKSKLILFLICCLELSSFAQQDYLNKGNSFLENKEYAKAEQTFKQAIKAEPKNLVYQSQLALVFIEQNKFTEAQSTLKKVLKVESNNLAAIWYSGLLNFKTEKDREAIANFEKALRFIKTSDGQYFAANWFIAKSYSRLLSTTGIDYREADRMFFCYQEYLRLQSKAPDAKSIKDYVDQMKAKRPGEEVKNWVEK